MKPPLLWLAACALVCLAPLARADDDDQAFTAPEAFRDFTVEDEELEPEDQDLPRFRLELWQRTGALAETRIKKGPHSNARRIHLHRDLHVPRVPIYGFRLIADLRFHEDWLVGAHVTANVFDGPRRNVHYRGVAINGRTITEPSETRLEFTFSEAYVRMVFRDNARIRLAFGLGVAWVSFRLQVLGATQRADGRIQDVLAPSIGYYFSFALWEHFLVWVENTNALISPTRFPSYASEIRAGFRFPFGKHLELGVGVGISSAQLEDLRELWGGQEPPDTYRWRRASWTLYTIEVGMAFRF